MAHKRPLVTVIISAFNSSEFIEETLGSVRNQTWDELELIVSDDCSTDKTVDICLNWINDHKSRFIRTELIVSDHNTGVAGNANRGLRAAEGEWVKFIGADDTLKTNCIRDNMTFVTNNPEIKVLFSKVEVYRDNFEITNYLKSIPGAIFPHGSILSPGITAEEQYKLLLITDRIHFSPSFFINRQTLQSVGGFDERFPLMEDHPLWLNLTKAGHKLHFMDKLTVNYRQHSSAINNTQVNYLVKPNYFRSEEFRRIYTYPHLPRDIRLNQQWNWLVSKPFRNCQLNRKTRLNNLLYAILTIYLNPFTYYLYIKRRMIKNIELKEFYL